MIKKITMIWVYKGIIQKSDEDVYEYGLDLMLYTILNIVVILCSATIIKKLSESVALLSVIIPLQSIGGGYHAETHLRCFMIMYIGWWGSILILPLIPVEVALIMICVAILVVCRFAPISHKNVKMSALQREKMRKYARMLAIIYGASSTMFIFFVSVRIGIALSTGLGIISLSMLLAQCKALLAK